MIRHPQPGQRVRLHYAAEKQAATPWHGYGVVIAAAKGRPNNVRVKLSEGVEVVVPCGNLIAVPEAA